MQKANQLLQGPYLTPPLLALLQMPFNPTPQKKKKAFKPRLHTPTLHAILERQTLPIPATDAECKHPQNPSQTQHHDWQTNLIKTWNLRTQIKP